MSEDTALTPNNLCIPEDAFEQFQANSMYQEEEYITLSDIVPNQSKPHDMTDVIDLPFDNEVIVSSENEQNNEVVVNNNADGIECLQQIVSTSDFVENINMPNEDRFLEELNDTTDYKDTTDQSLYSENQVSRKRGRKPKASRLPSTAISDKTITPFSSHPNSSDTNIIKSQKRRGRPIKIKRGPTKNINPAIVKPTKPKRGRKPKALIKDEKGLENIVKSDDETMKKDIDSQFDDANDNSGNLNNTYSNELEESLLDSEYTPIKSKARRKSQLSKSQLNKTTNPDSTTDLENTSSLDNDELDDISLSKLKHIPGEVNEKIDDSEVETKPKKRGRKGRQRKVTPVTEDSTNKTTDDIEEDEDDFSLGKLKEINKEKRESDSMNNDQPALEDNSLITEVNQDLDNSLENRLKTSNETSQNKRNTKMPLMSDFEYNLDSIISNNVNGDNNLLIEDNSKRRSRNKVPKLHYEEESDEDPFANMELSDDEPRKRKGNKYYSDDEYIPGKKGSQKDVESTDSEVNEDDMIGEIKRPKRRNTFKKSETASPRKRGKKNNDNVATSEQGDANNEIESTSGTKTESGQSTKPQSFWGGTNEFENFLAKKIQNTNLKIKKVSSNIPTERKVAPLEIPVVNPEVKKTVEMSCQTNEVKKYSTSVQTSSPYELIMKETLALTPEQSEKACQFLEGIVTTTAELGQLMTQKSQDFIKKKINTTHVTDTMKMDYCVKKSFLLFKLAKHNLMQMEEDLAKQYEEFLQTHKLTSCREEQKKVTPKPKESNSDSDCEIVSEEPAAKPKAKAQEKPKFNPKTVFLNKELSIKIAKKQTVPVKAKKDLNNLNIKGRHTVWINDTVMVKKVSPTHSFLAQDSRNKKPPDNQYVTTKMVSDFFESYYRQRALSVCAPFITTDWLNVGLESVCYYFVVQPPLYSNDANISNNANVPETNNNLRIIKSTTNNNSPSSPETLSNICFNFVKKYLMMHDSSQVNRVKKHIENGLTEQSNMPLSLKKLSLNKVSNTINANKDTINWSSGSPRIERKKMVPPTVKSLKTLCHMRILDLMSDSSQESSRRGQNMSVTETYNSDDDESGFLQNNYTAHSDLDSSDFNTFGIEGVCTSKGNTDDIYSQDGYTLPHANGVKSLFSLCVKFVQKKQVYDSMKIVNLQPKTLKQLGFDNIHKLLYGYFPKNINQNFDGITIEGLTINSVNTLSEEAFLSLEPSHGDISTVTDYMDDYDEEDDHNYEMDYGATEENNQNEPSWASQVQLQEPISCFSLANSAQNHDNLNEYNASDSIPMITRIKLEPLDEISENIELTNITVKSEPNQQIPGLNAMTIIPNLKAEMTEDITSRMLQRQDSNSFDREVFENFVATNKMMVALNYDEDGDTFSQSGQRIRRQHEPDYVEGYDPNLGLLLPQTYEPFNVETAKGSLMESSSDESNKNTKHASKKKTDKRKTRPKKPDPKITKDTTLSVFPTAKGNKELSSSKNNKEPPPSTKAKGPNVELNALTRRMKERIRQEEENEEDSTDSESENLPRLRTRKKGDAKEDSKVENNDKIKQKDTQIKDKQTNRIKENEIQCNNVDSTDQNDDDVPFAGFSATEQNEITLYDKYMKAIKKETTKVESVSKAQSDDEDRPESPLIDHEEPVELLECEPTMPIFDDADDKPLKKQRPKVGPKSKQASQKVLPYKERHGWHCYPINMDDAKLYQKSSLVLEKLPETFVQTYFEYQGISAKDKTDKEIDKLTNLNSLYRSNLSEGRPRKGKKDGKSLDGSHSDSCMDNDNDYNELTPSEDEGANPDDEPPPPVPQKQAENSLAKSLLMNDNDSDSDSALVKVKQELEDPSNEPKKHKDKHVKKKLVIPIGNKEDLMLTADKSLKTELNLLHAPVVLKDVKEITSEGPVTRNKKEKSSKHQASGSKAKSDEDSSSEEEKQWVNRKEKLLKRVDRKEDLNADDAKSAKLVSEFIERRSKKSDSRKRNEMPGSRSRRSAKKFLEREKQLRVLSRELFGEQSTDLTLSKRSAAYYKGRRNIRKVIDKKSLAISTVAANKEEIERRRRLHIRQNRLRDLLGCEEGVNVLVINDEVCLEYDFEEDRPAVTIHQFFTKVMKAHQYEGVKFMWDACFESLAMIDAGHRGGGCILAHCMGLGKTLQVLALLHTVLTHPRVGMKRVLVCCPLSTVLNWVDEIHKWIGPVTNQIKQKKLRRTLQVFELSKLKKTYERAYQLEDWYNGGGIFIIGYELFRSLSTLDPDLDDVRPTIINKIRTALLDPGPDIIVCDEGHLLKNDCSVLAVAMSRVVTKRRIVLTGTPMQNNLREYYCMVNFVKPNLLGTYAEYSNRYENPIMNGQHRDSRDEDIKLMKTRTHILHKVLEGCLQRQEASVLYPYLPKKHEYTVFIPLTQCQWDLYKHYLRNYGMQSKQNVLKDFHILQKIWSHPQVLHNFQTKVRIQKDKIKAERQEDDLYAEDLEEIKLSMTEQWWLEYSEGSNMLESLESSNKFVVVFRILEECVALGDKVLIFSTSLFCLDALEYFLKKINKWRLGTEYYRLDGSVPAEVRQKWCREFNAENNVNTKLFLVSTRAGCLGLNMTAANRVIILDTSWNPAHDIQSIFRVYRFGQKKDCYIYRLVAMGTMEQKIYERSVTKQAVACRVVDEQQIDRHYNMAELTELYKFDESGATVAGGVAVGVSDVALLRVARSAALHAVHEHDSLLRGSQEHALPEHERHAAWMQFQQEQAHKQFENKLVTNIPKLTLKRIDGQQDYSRTYETPTFDSFSTKQDSDDDPTKRKRGRPRKMRHSTLQDPDRQNDEDCPTNLIVDTIQLKQEPSDSEPYKNKRGRPRKKRPDDDAPGTSREQTSPDLNDPVSRNQEEIMVEQIAEILLQYNFQSKKQATEITSLVANVTNIVKKGYIAEGTDDLTASIARVLLMKRMSIPVVNDIMCESINNTTNSSANGKVKRRAALAAKINMDSIIQDNNDVINLDDDDDDKSDRGDTDFVPEVQDYQEPESLCNRYKSKIKAKLRLPNANESQPPQETTDRKSYRGVKAVNSKSYQGTDNSILLSDDEEDNQPLLKPGNDAQSAEVTQENEVDEDAFPLPMNVLSNDNFINIVAHTYLVGNPMLDKDAAMLAARYSVQKALVETRETGKPISSGPIYEIAVKVIGKDVLKQMHQSNVKKGTKESDKRINAFMTKEAIGGSQAPVEKKTRQEPRLVKCTTSAAAGVVPVGLIKSIHMGSSNKAPPPSQPYEECILPDDDTPHPTVLETSTSRPTGTASAKPRPRPGPRSRRERASPSICLDSDEEPPPSAPPADIPAIKLKIRVPRVVPVSQPIRAAPPPSAPDPKPRPGPAFTKKPLVTCPAAPPAPEKPPIKSNKTRCKPGDIFRISKTGEIEIIDIQNLKNSNSTSEGSVSIDLTEFGEPPAPAATGAKRRGDAAGQSDKPSAPKTPACRPIAPKPTPSAPTTKSNESKTTPTQAGKRPSEGTGLLRARLSKAAEDDNPLAILRDVVHIQAAEEPEPPAPRPARASLAKPASDKLKQSNISIQHVVSGEVGKAPGALASIPTQIMKQVHERMAKQSTPTKAALMDRIKPLLNSTPKKITDKSSNMKWLEVTPKVTLNSSKPKVGTIKCLVDSTPTASSNNKGIALNFRSSKTATKSGPTMLLPLLQAKDNKRGAQPSTSNESSAPKKRRSQPMTLADFDIDDTDDIIELE